MSRLLNVVSDLIRFKSIFWEPASQKASNDNVHFEFSIAGDIYGIFEHTIRDSVHIHK